MGVKEVLMCTLYGWKDWVSFQTGVHSLLGD